MAKSKAAAGPTHIKDLVPDPKNRRQHNPRNIGMVVDALHAVGAARSIVIDEDNVILAGNGVTEAAAEAGITKLRVIEASGDELIAVRRSGLTDEQKRHLAIADNRSAELAQWNAAQFREDLGAGLEFTKFFSEDELKAILGTAEPEEGLTDPDDVPEERPTGIVAGDLFELGRHRLLCGDSTAQGDVDRLLAGDMPQAIVTSPPYGVGMEYEGAPVQSETVSLVSAVFTVWAPTVSENGFAFVNFGERYVWPVPMLQVYHDLFVNVFGWRWYDQRFWKRSSVGLAIWNTTQPRAMSQCELLLTFKNGKSGYPVNAFEISKEQLWECPGSSAGIDHPAVMAVGIAENAVTIYSQPDDVIAEPFSGAGTTMLAAERLGRCCRSIEIEPKYVQVAIDRWEAFTGQKAQKVGEAVRS